MPWRLFPPFRVLLWILKRKEDSPKFFFSADHGWSSSPNNGNVSIFIKMQFLSSKVSVNPLNVCWESHFAMYFLPSFLHETTGTLKKTPLLHTMLKCKQNNRKKISCYLCWTGMTSHRNLIVFLIECMSQTGLTTPCIRLTDL